MEKYDYMSAVKSDIMDWLKEKGHIGQSKRDSIYDNLWMCDSVTGNGSGSYTFNTWKAEENLCHNMDLLGEALEEFGYGENEVNVVEKGAEWCDVTIRCYLLGQVLDECLE